MDKLPENDIKTRYSPKQSCVQENQNNSSGMSHSFSDQYVRGEEVCSSENCVNEMLAGNESTHQSGVKETSCKITTVDCQSAEDVKCSDSHEQPVPDICLIISPSSSFDNIQQEVAVDVSPSECIVITDKSDCHTPSETSNDSGPYNESELSYDDSLKAVGINGCDNDVSPDQLLKEVNEVLCATLKSLSRVGSEVQEPSTILDNVESLNSVDGREEFSEKSNQIHEDIVESSLCSETSEIVFDQDDENCTNGIVSKRNVVDVEFSIPIKLKVPGTNVDIEECDVTDKICPSTLTFSSGDGFSCSASTTLCNHKLFKTVATSVVDEILEKAKKHILEQNHDNSVIVLEGSYVNCEKNVEQVSDNLGQAMDEPLSKNTGVSGNTENISEVFNFGQCLDLNFSVDNNPGQIVPNVSISDVTVVAPPCVDDHLHNIPESSSECLMPVMCDGSGHSSPNQCLDNSTLVSNMSGSQNVSNAPDCDFEAKNPVREDHLNSEAKVNSSNDSSITSDVADEHVDEVLASENEIVTLNVELISEGVKASGDVFENNLCKDNPESFRYQDLSPEAKVISSKDVESEVKCSIVSNGSCLKECSSSHLEKCEEEIPISSVPTPVLSVKNLDESEDLDLNPSLDVQKPLNDITAPLTLDENEGDTDLKCANPELNSENVIATDNMTTNCVSVNDETGSCSEVNVTTVKDTTEEAAPADRPLLTSFQQNAEEEPFCAKKDVITEEMKTVSGKDDSVSPHENTENEKPVSGKQELSAEVLIGNADTAACISLQDNIKDCEKPICVEQEVKSEEVSLKDDINASIPLLEITEDLLVEHDFTTTSKVTEIPLAKQELMEAKTTALNPNEGSVQMSYSTAPSQFIVPTVNVCPPIMEETYDGITDDESEMSHATSDSESDSNVKMVKTVGDGINTINYRPLLEEDSNDRSTLSLISELDEASVKEDNLDNELLEDESASLIMDYSSEPAGRIHEDILSKSEVVQRVKGQRIRHEKMVVQVEEQPRIDEEHIEEKVGEEGTQSDKYATKIKDIRDALNSNDSFERLRELARSEGGLVNDELRRSAWPRLLCIEPSSVNSPLPAINMEDLRAHREFNQVVLDVNRSLRRLPSKISPAERANLQNQLTEIILRVLMKRQDLSYYQGYHDVAVTILLVAGKDAAFRILERISLDHLSDCMLPTMERTMYLLNYIYPLLKRINPALAERLDSLEVGTIFCLPWYLTWYGYSLNRYDDIVRVFDYFLASPTLAPLYLAAVVVGRRSAEVLAADSDQATVHALLSRIPETLPLEELLREATDLYRTYPPENIEKEVHERCERLQKAQQEEEEQRKRIRQRRMVQRRHSMPTIAARQMPGWYFIDRFLGLPMAFQGRRIIQVSATVMFGMIAWHLRNEMYRYF